MEKIKIQFLKEIADHKLEIARNNDVDRHLKFRGKACFLWFDIITWGGSFCIQGDMGTWVFSHTHDMFEFFSHGQKEDLRINPRYWAEKINMCEGHEKHNYQEWSSDKFKKHITQFVSEFNKECDEENVITKDELESLLDTASDEFYAINEVLSFRDNELYILEDCGDFCDYKYHFIWCLYAIVWGINKYNELTRGQTVLECVQTDNLPPPPAEAA